MTETIHIGTPPITVHLRPNIRAKRYTLRISNKDGKISLTLPRGAKMQEACEFAKAQEGWMRKHLARQLPEILPAFGEQILLDGRLVTIAKATGRRVVLAGDVLNVSATSAQLGGKLRGFYKTLARERLVIASERYADALGVKMGRVTLRDTRSRWGSCTSAGNLMYSWRLMMAPPSVQDYVAAHEACHLIEMNHSQAYWALVEQIYPNYQPQRDWLRKNGARLHQYLL
ncbi:zinc metalloprotease [Amylibacter marinus]|uniref:Zinc metalloprotease n=1 Tax=Amylibacter marinus TaxID=1475483 RepID=A0ABQ5VTC6_9RHOB|nr:SprT family zinc-dependent metalloprotease [Amylibacter marinus]GLQ34525.1 zinc metalloprotease [Amylibacter marinus]